MQVQTIQSNNYNTPSFGELQITKNGNLLIKSLPNKANVWRKINSWKRELAETKYFNLQIDGLIAELNADLRMNIRSKNSYDTSDCEAPLHVQNNPKGKALTVYGTDLLDCGDWVSYSLKFNTKDDACNAYNTLTKFKSGYSATAVEKMQYAVDSVKVLEQAFENMYENRLVKLPFCKRLQIALSVLKG